MRNLKSFFKKTLYISILLFFIWACQGGREANRQQNIKPLGNIESGKAGEEKHSNIADKSTASPPPSNLDVLNNLSKLYLSQSNALQSELSRERQQLLMEHKELLQQRPNNANKQDEEDGNFNTEEYSKIVENQFQNPKNAPLSTFSIDVDKASYSNSRRMIINGQMPYKDAVRIEEFVNYFDYEYPNPTGEHPFSIITEVSSCPWNPENQLVHIGLQGKKLDYDKLAPSNLVFLIDVSGSMAGENRLPLLKSSLKLLINELSEKDKIAIVVYAGAAGLVLPSTPASEKSKIIKVLDKLEAGGSTAGGQGIKLAYQVAKENFIAEGNNRIILATDGDFNVGVSSTSELVRLVEEKRKEGIFLTLCGFGMGNYKDDRMEEIAKNGNGNYFYIDNINEAKKVFVKEMRATLFTIAKDVKIQVEFNPAKVQAYRLIGYENRMLKDVDFNDDKKDAGELGAGHTVTALYEIIPVGVKSEYLKSVDDLKYQSNQNTNAANNDELMTIKFRYKKPSEDTSQLMTHVLKDKSKKLEETSDNFRFSASVAEFGLLLRDSEFKGNANYNQIISLAKGAKGNDSEGYRAEFIQLVENCQLMQGEKTQD
ncbi:vWA domain-containing protein [Thermoflexibacter ruber]|uniref:Ca-activated chloride channel family protein n=1 Tax=Thermoflexibacter ruber TaxID=1003 RepID=A0A1I2IR03_9BACT|nr:VWA domain-containing protein [Thermoflexibacter ruber]SFF44745.1 Ca-activated chloride channel family protein [Thermoflexibacter ruber]